MHHDAPELHGVHLKCTEWGLHLWGTGLANNVFASCRSQYEAAAGRLDVWPRPIRGNAADFAKGQQLRIEKSAALCLIFLQFLEIIAFSYIFPVRRRKRSSMAPV